MAMDEVRWGILGCGDVTEVKSGPIVMNRPGTSRVVAVMRRDADKAADYARRHDVSRHYADAAQLINDPEVNAVYIAAPPGSHWRYAEQVAAAGKACYVEKPMARTAGECRAMIEVFERAGRPLLVAYYRRRLPRFVEVKRLLHAGRLGKITGVHYELVRPFSPGRDHGWRTDPAVSGGGLFLDLGSHLLDLLDFLLGPLTNVAGVATRHGDGRTDVEDTVAMSFAHPDGVTGTARWNFAGARRADCLVIDGTEASLTASCFGNEPLEVTDRDGRVDSIDRPHGKHVQEHLMTDVIAHLRGVGECPSTGTSALRTSRVMDVVLAGYYGDREVWLDGVAS